MRGRLRPEMQAALEQVRLLSRVAAAAGCRVFAPDYALAPEQPFPAPVDEARATLAMLRERAAKLGLPVDRMYLTAAECDILRDGAARFAQRLDRQGIPHRFRLCDGMGHAFMGYGRMISAFAFIHSEAAAFLDATVTASASTPPA